MSLNKIVLKTLPFARRNVLLNQVRHDSVISSPPTYRMPFAQKVVMGGAMCLSIAVIPVWVLCNITSYNAPKEE